MTEVTQPLALVWEGDRAPFAKAFIKAQQATEAVKKAASNPAFKSKYADLSEVVEATVPALNSAGIGVMQAPAFDGEMVSIETVLMHESGSSVTCVLKLRPSKMDPQGVGSAITYGRRYSLLAMTGAAPEDDDGNAASGPRDGHPQNAQPKPQPSLLDRLSAALGAVTKARTIEEVQKLYGQTAPLRADLEKADKDGLAKLEAALAARVTALDDTPFDGPQQEAA